MLPPVVDQEVIPPSKTSSAVFAAMTSSPLMFDLYMPVQAALVVEIALTGVALDGVLLVSGHSI